MGEAAVAKRQQQEPGMDVIGVHQLAPHLSDRVIAAPAIDGNKKSAVISQLPTDAAVSDLADAPEPSLTGTGDTPNGELYREVERIWQQIRQRGQQPTPELLANEIGPEALARFLSTYPNAERLLTDRKPLPPPEPSNVEPGQ